MENEARPSKLDSRSAELPDGFEKPDSASGVPGKRAPDESAEKRPEKREDRNPRPRHADEKQVDNKDSEVPQQLQDWEAAIREAQKSTLKACRRAAWIEETKAYQERGCDTGSEYARQVFDSSRQWWYQRVHAGQVFNALLEKRSASNAFDDSFPLPVNLGQTQPLHSHRDDPAFLWKAWTTVVDRHGDRPRRADVDDVEEELTSDGAPSRSEDDGDTSSEEDDEPRKRNDSSSSGDSANGPDGGSENKDKASSATGGSRAEDSGEASENPVDADGTAASDGSSGAGTVGSEEGTDGEGSDASRDSGADEWMRTGDLAVRLSEEDGATSRTLAEPTKERVESVARAADAKEARLDRSSAERMIASRVWRVLSPSPHGIGAGLPEEETAEAALWTSRLNQITDVPPGADGERVLVSPGVDLFAEAVPAGVIRAILARCRDAKHLPVVFTRHLGRASTFDLSGLWIGTLADRSRLQDKEQALSDAAPEAAVRWLLYDVENEDAEEPPSFSDSTDWVVYDPGDRNAGVALTLGEARALTSAAEASGAGWSFRDAFTTCGSSLPRRAAS